jgi:hypothetical protein
MPSSVEDFIHSYKLLAGICPNHKSSEPSKKKATLVAGVDGTMETRPCRPLQTLGKRQFATLTPQFLLSYIFIQFFLQTQKIAALWP